MVRHELLLCLCKLLESLYSIACVEWVESRELLSRLRVTKPFDVAEAIGRESAVAVLLGVVLPVVVVYWVEWI